MEKSASMYSEKHSFHMNSSEQEKSLALITSETAQESSMKIKNQIRAAFIWISEKLPCTRPQFQIVFGSDGSKKKEE
jgi:hypothetical protein